MIIPVYQPLGGSSHQLAAKAAGYYGEKATHTGTLDPMAEGVLIVLTGNDRFQKEKLSAYKKEYRFEILFGAATDSLDLLGLIEEREAGSFVAGSQLEQTIKELLPDFTCRQKQELPAFSAKRIAGGSYFDRAKSGKKPPAAFQEIEIFSLELNSIRETRATDIKENIEFKIGQVRGSFRQEEILTAWQSFFAENSRKTMIIASLTAVTSKRTYIRGLVRDLSQRLQLPSVTYSIVRTANGPYTVPDCICLI